MNDRRTLDDLLGADPHDPGCDAVFELLDEYVDAELSSHDASRQHPEVAAHLRGCPACHEDYVGLLEAVQSGPDDSS